MGANEADNDGRQMARPIGLFFTTAEMSMRMGRAMHSGIEEAQTNYTMYFSGPVAN